jgi:hypothetical protein
LKFTLEEFTVVLLFSPTLSPVGPKK